MSNQRSGREFGNAHGGSRDIVPALKQAASSISGIAKRVKNHRYQCKTLAEFCAELMTLVDAHQQANAELAGTATPTTGDEFSATKNEQRLQDCFSKFTSVSQEINDDLSRWADYDWQHALIEQHAINRAVKEYRIRMLMCFVESNVTFSLNHEKWTKHFKLAIQRDRDELNRILAEHEDVINLISALNVGLITVGSRQNLSVAQRTAVTVHENMQHLQWTLRIEPRDSPDFTESEETLRELLAATRLPLPIAHVNVEVVKLSEDPKHHSAQWDIFDGKWLGSSTKLVALKQSREAVPKEITLRRIERQVAILRRLRHKNIIETYGWMNSAEGRPTLVTPWMTNGNVIKFLSKNPQADRMVLLLDILRALEYLHSQKDPVLHGALRPSNVLVSDDGHAVLSDFLRSKQILDSSSGAEVTNSAGSQLALRFLAPETSAEPAIAGPPADIYSWAMTALQIMGCDKPYELEKTAVPFALTRNTPRIVIMINAGQCPDPKEYDMRKYPKGLWDIFRRCWVKDPQPRPTAAQVIHDLLKIRPDLEDFGGRMVESR